MPTITENHIRRVAQRISFQVSRDEIREELLLQGFLEEEVFLLYTAAQLFLKSHGEDERDRQAKLAGLV